MSASAWNLAIPSRARPFLVVLLTVLLLLPAPLASAATVVQASGTNTLTSFVSTVVQSAGGVTTLSVASTSSFTGTFTGSSVAQVTCLVRASGRGTCQGTETFTGAVSGHSGTVDFFVAFTIEGDAFQGRAVITGGTAALGGDLSFQGTGSNFTYAGRVVLP